MVYQDWGSAAVLLSILLCMGVWLTGLLLKFSHYM